MTSRGCPYKCKFCHNLFGKIFRKRSAENIYEEVSLLYKRGIRDFYIIDDNFGIDKKRALKFFRLIYKGNIAGKIRIYFVNGLRADTIDRQFIDEMVKAGTIWVGYAIESGSKRIQKTMNKNLDLKKAQRIIKYSAQKGIIVNYWAMLGYGDETLKEAEETLNFMEKLPPSTIPMLFVWKPYEGTPAYEELSKTEKKQARDNAEGIYHDFSRLLNKDIGYIKILKKWKNIIRSPERISQTAKILKKNGYRKDEIEDTFALLYPEKELRKAYNLMYSKLSGGEIDGIFTSKESMINKKLEEMKIIKRMPNGSCAYLSKGTTLKNKIIKIINQELQKSGAKEIELPIQISDSMLNKTPTGDFRKATAYKIAKGIDKLNLIGYLAPTSEEIMVFLAKNLGIKKGDYYQIGKKFRAESKTDGILRLREFTMEDGYSFHKSEKSLDKEYENMKQTYCRIFKRLDLNIEVCEMAIGGLGEKSQEILIKEGEDEFPKQNKLLRSLKVKLGGKRIIIKNLEKLMNQIKATNE